MFPALIKVMAKECPFLLIKSRLVLESNRELQPARNNPIFHQFCRTMYLASFSNDHCYKKLMSNPRIAKYCIEKLLSVKVDEIIPTAKDYRLTYKSAEVKFDYRCKINNEYIAFDMQQWHRPDVLLRFDMYHAVNKVAQMEEVSWANPNFPKKKAKKKPSTTSTSSHVVGGGASGAAAQLPSPIKESAENTPSDAPKTAAKVSPKTEAKMSPKTEAKMPSQMAKASAAPSDVIQTGDPKVTFKDDTLHYKIALNNPDLVPPIIDVSATITPPKAAAKATKQRRDIDYNELKTCITIVWFAHQKLGMSRDIIRLMQNVPREMFKMAEQFYLEGTVPLRVTTPPKKSSKKSAKKKKAKTKAKSGNGAASATLLTTEEYLVYKDLKKLLTKETPWSKLLKGELVFVMQKNIMANGKVDADYYRLVKFANLTQNDNNKRADFAEFMDDPIFCEMMEVLRIDHMTSKDFDEINRAEKHVRDIQVQMMLLEEQEEQLEEQEQQLEQQEAKIKAMEQAEKRKLEEKDAKIKAIEQAEKRKLEEKDAKIKAMEEAQSRLLEEQEAEKRKQRALIQNLHQLQKMPVATIATIMQLDLEVVERILKE